MIQENPWGARNYSDILLEGLEYIEDRKNGRIKSFKTPWLGLNQAGVGGLEWGSMLSIAARPGAGKTMISTQILRESRIMNPDQDFNILEFQFEMGPKQSASRAFAAKTALDYNLILSTTKQIDDFAIDQIKKYIAETAHLERRGYKRMQICKPITHREMEKAIHHYYNTLGGKPLIVTIDHSWLIVKDKDEKEKIATLYNTVETLMKVKNELPVIIIMLSQLNRTIDEASRQAPGIIGNYPTSSDIFGGDALMQGSDMVIALNRPYKSNIHVYGPKGYVTKTEDIFAHLLKIRNGGDDVGMLYMKAEFNLQRMIEVPEPGQTAATPSNWQLKSKRAFTI